MFLFNKKKKKRRLTVSRVLFPCLAAADACHLSTIAVAGNLYRSTLRLGQGETLKRRYT